MKSIRHFLEHFFTPKETNNFRARVLHAKFLTYYLIFFLVLAFGVKLISTHSGQVLGFATDITKEKLFELTNEVRIKNDAQRLVSNQDLEQAAQKKAVDMFAKNYWSHYSPEGKTPWDFIIGAGYNYEFAGENLAKNFLFSQGVIDAWMNSPSHKENIIRNDYSQVGFAVVNGILNGEETTLVVQMFGKPLESTNPIENPRAYNGIPNTQKRVLEEKVQPNILGKKLQSTNLAGISLDINIFFLSFFLISLILDLYFALRLGIIRITGKNLAHIIFISSILVGVFILTKGSIL